MCMKRQGPREQKDAQGSTQLWLLAAAESDLVHPVPQFPYLGNEADCQKVKHAAAWAVEFRRLMGLPIPLAQAAHPIQPRFSATSMILGQQRTHVCRGPHWRSFPG